MAVCIVHSNWRQLLVEAESSVKRLGRPKSQQRSVVLCWRAVIQALPEWKLQHSARGSSSVMLPWCEHSWLLLIEKYLLKSWCHEQHRYKVFEGSGDNWGGKCLLCTTWNKASWMCGWPPKRRAVHALQKNVYPFPFTALEHRYVNMDYLFFSPLQNTPLKTFNVSYDITCQWSRHLWERMTTLPHPMHLPFKEKTANFFVPKFHLPTHVAKCQWKYSLNFTKGIARTDGEAPERGWSTLNATVSSTKEMGPGHRCDILDDLIGDSNWKKLVGLGGSNSE